MKFPLGSVVATPNATQAFDREFLAASLKRHSDGDWGDVRQTDRDENEEALKQGFRLLSIYKKDGKELFIITEADRSVTTLLLPEDY